MKVRGEIPALLKREATCKDIYICNFFRKAEFSLMAFR